MKGGTLSIWGAPSTSWRDIPYLFDTSSDDNTKELVPHTIVVIPNLCSRGAPPISQILRDDALGLPELSTCFPLCTVRWERCGIIPPCTISLPQTPTLIFRVPNRRKPLHRCRSSSFDLLLISCPGRRPKTCQLATAEFSGIAYLRHNASAGFENGLGFCTEIFRSLSSCHILPSRSVP